MTLWIRVQGQENKEKEVPVLFGDLDIFVAKRYEIDQIR
jgi:hypothetical protein